MIRFLGPGPAAVLAFLACVPAAAQDGGWAQKRLSFSKEFEDARKDAQRESLVKGLAALAPADESGRAELAKLVVTALTIELNEKKELEVSGPVLDACEEALRSCSGKKSVEFLTKMAKSSPQWRIRFHVIRALNRLDDAEVLETLAHLTDDKEPRVQVAALDALGTRKDARRWAEAYWKVVKDAKASWEPKVSALRALGASADEAQVKPLVDHLRNLAKSEGRLREETAAALRTLTGKEGSVEAAGWDAILAEKKQVASGAAAGQVVMTGAKPANFYGITTASTKIFFILDVSGSMQEPASEPPLQDKGVTLSGVGGGKPSAKEDALVKLKKELVDDKKVTTRIESAKKELVNSIYNLSPGVMFNIVTFGTGAKPWQAKMVAASPDNKLAAIQYLHGVQADHMNTNTWEALELAMGIGDRQGEFASSLGGADTCYLLSDGAPTGGKLADPKRILEEVDKVIKLRKFTIHCVCLGDPDKAKEYKMNPKFLEDLAKLTGGKFVHVKQ